MGAPGTMQIGEVAARTELSLRSLRHWEEVGLLPPSGRSEGGFRLYTEADVEKILLVRRMKPLGFSLEEMRQVLADVATLSAGDDPDARERLRSIGEETDVRRARLVRQVEMADEFRGLVEEWLA